MENCADGMMEVDTDNDEFENLYKEFQSLIYKTESESETESETEYPDITGSCFPTSLGFQLRQEVLLVGDPTKVHRRDQIVYAVHAKWNFECAILLKFLKFIIPLEMQHSPIYYAEMAVRFIRTETCCSRDKHWAVLIGGPDSGSLPRLWLADKAGILAIKERTSIGDCRHLVDFALNKKNFKSDMTVDTVIDICEYVRVIIKDNTPCSDVPDILKSVYLSPSPSILGNSSQPSPTLDHDDLVTAFSKVSTSGDSSECC